MRQIVGSVQLGSIEGRFGLLLSLEWSREESEKEREREREGGRRRGRGNLHVKTNSKINFFIGTKSWFFTTKAVPWIAVLHWNGSAAVLSWALF